MRTTSEEIEILQYEGIGKDSLVFEIYRVWFTTA